MDRLTDVSVDLSKRCRRATCPGAFAHSCAVFCLTTHVAATYDRQEEAMIVKASEDGPTPGAADEGAGKDRSARRKYEPPVIISYTNEEIREKLGPAMAVDRCSVIPSPE